MRGKGATPGNSNARRKLDWREAIQREVAKAGGNYAEGLARCARKLVEMALAGDQWALKELGERIDGKAPETVSLTLTNRAAEEMTDDELAAIAAGRSQGAAESAGGAEPAGPVH